MCFVMFTEIFEHFSFLFSISGNINFFVVVVLFLFSVMKKFSKKFVSRCVYCNVLQATKSDILSE